MQIQNSYTSQIQQVPKSVKAESSEKQQKVNSIEHSYDNPMLDKRANNILDKIISEKGLSSEDSNDIKMKLILMSTEFSVDSNGRLIDAPPPKNPDMSQTAVAKRIDKLLNNLKLNLNTGDFQEENNQLYKTATELKTLYNADYKPLNITA